MASFSERLKAANAAVPMVSNMALSNEGITVASVEPSAGIMTLEEPYDGLAYSGEEWTLSTDYACTKDNGYGRHYEDSNYATVDELKTVTVSPVQVNLTQEENSQYIPFEMFRYYDGIDLMNMKLSIYFVNKEYGYGNSDVINVEYSNTKIRFGWVVPKEATAIAGRLQFEIHATGINPLGYNYVLKTRPNNELNIEESLQGNGQIIVNGEEWATNVVEEVVKAAEDAKGAKNLAEGYAASAKSSLDEMKTTIAGMETSITQAVTTNVSGNLDNLVNEKMDNYYTKDETYSKAEIDAIDVTEQLGDYALKTEIPVNVSQLNNDAGYLTEHQSLEDYALKTELEGLATEQFVTDAISSADISDKLNEYAKIEDVYDKATVDDKVANVKVDLTGYAKTEDVNKADELLRTDIDTNKTNIQTANTSIASINATLESIDKSPNAYYITTYNEPYTFEGVEYTGENTLVVYEIYNKDKENETRTVVAAHVIQGGSGSGSSNTITIERITNSPLVVTSNDDIVIEYNFIGTDNSGEDISQGNATWKLGNQVIKTEKIYTGKNSVDLTDYINIGSDQKVTLIITDDIGTISQKSWYISVVDVKLTSTFDDTRTYTANSPVTFTYTPYGAIDKTVHILMDGKEIDTVTSLKSASGLSTSYTIPAQSHGTHLVEIYMTATINDNDIESNHIVKDVMWQDGASTLPLIGCVSQEFTAKQYAATNIVYTVYDPSTETPSVTLRATYMSEDGEVETYNSTITMTSNTDTWQFKTDIIGEHTLTITCGETVKILKATIVDLGIEVNPIIAGLVFDFNPVGYSNNDENRLWSQNDIAMTVSDNFDWVNGGYQIDENGDQYFCIKAGTSAEINYELFGDDAKTNGKQMKLIFKTMNVADSETTFLECLSDTIGTDAIGIEMKAQTANIYAKTETLPLPYAEEEIIEFEFNITTSTDTIPMVMGYEDGVSTRPMVYGTSHDFQQHKDHRKIISLGSNDCDLYIYRFKVYNTSLSDRDILNNFIADARSAEEMIKRYERNQIYKDGELTPEYLAEMCPDLRIIKIDCPRFTKDKDDKVAGTTIECIYVNGDPIYDNWVATDCVHSGQGTSSNNYGASGRNLDLIMKTYKDYGNSPTITLGDGKTVVSKVSLTRESIPANYYNVKVNIASSENANNALLAKRYNEYNPYKRPFVREDESIIPYIKDTMEFQNCVIFLRESGNVEHTEFADTNWHFYAIGNMGDSKKTDDSRLTDPTDPYECILEVMDNTLPLSTMPTGKIDEDGYPVYPINPSEWVVGNSAYDALQAELFDESKATDKDNGLADTYGWRYIYEDGTDEENAEAKAYVENQWREFYKFIVTSTDEEFKAHLGDWCVLDSVMYYYLFTLRYTMTDNHAKNSFIHYGKTGEVDSEGNPIRKWDLCFLYDADTALGIDNYGRMSYRYGYEEIDFVDGTFDWVWNAPMHVFFLRLREVFADELCTLYNRLEGEGAWSATGLINQFNDWQMQFPEELWRVDIERKYIRTYTSSYINGEAKPEFLKERANGRKKTQRAQFERNQEKYMSSKFGGTVASGDDIVLRCSVPNGNLAIPANFNITLTPYAYMYLAVKYNTSPPERVRVIPGQIYTFEYTADLADIIEIYSASSLKSIGDLSACYLINADFSNAAKIRELILGSDVEGYNNTNAITLGFGSNDLLNKLDIQNMSGLTSELDLSGLRNLEEFYGFGSNVSGLVFADGGNLRIAEIPSVGSLSMKNLSLLTDEGFEATSYNTLTKFVAENSQLDLVDLINNAANLYQVRLIGINWSLDDTTLLERLYNLSGVSNTGSNLDNSIVTGSVYVRNIKEYDLYKYQERWPDLIITYGAMTRQYIVTFVNDDGTVLDTQYVDMNNDAVEPIAAGRIEAPTKESTVSTDYIFAGWDSDFTNIGNHKTIKATYTESIRKYSVKYVQVFDNNTYTLQSSDTVDYGTYYFYEGDTPTYTGQEGSNKFYLFNRWDKSGFVDGDKVITAIYDECHYENNQYFVDKPFNELKPVELYALSKLIENGKIKILQDNSGFDYVENTNYNAGDVYSFKMGNDYDFADLEDKTYSFEDVFPRTFAGVSGDVYDTGIKIFDMDKDFVLAVDYEFDSTNTKETAVLMDCWKAGINHGYGFRLSCGQTSTGSGMSNPTIDWCGQSKDSATTSNREMLILRHIAGETGLYVYTSNLSGTAVNYFELDPGDNLVPFESTLIFGCGRQTTTVYNFHAKGTIHWAKLWYADLGDQACRNLAAYIHEDINLKIAGFYRQYLTEDINILAPISFIASKPLYTKKGIISSGSNAGGWATTDLNTWLNTRCYDGLPTQIKQIIRQVNVKSTAGSASSSIVSSPCYIYIPAVSELMNISPYNTTPYTSEVDGYPRCLPFFTDSEDRIMYDKDNATTIYWTRSPNAGYSSWYLCINTQGEISSYETMSLKYGIVVEFSI